MEEYGGWSPKARAFDAKHGASVVNGNGGWLLFEDGAARELTESGVMKEPPTDRYELARRKLAYYELRLREAVARFERARNQLQQIAASDMNARFVNPLPGFTLKEAELKLTALRDTARKCKASWEAAKAEAVAATPKEVLAHDHISAENRREKEALRDLVNRMVI